ncbi:Uncharacterised protein [Mycobacteroides abscessus subsp. abscessus]|nr:Uncharacterised protein [Mycobacteroides abscessus subsp. abscessus]
MRTTGAVACAKRWNVDPNADRAEPDRPVGLDLVAPETYVPMLRKLALAAVGVGLGAGLLAAVLVAWPIALAIGLVVAVPSSAARPCTRGCSSGNGASRWPRPPASNCSSSPAG